MGPVEYIVVAFPENHFSGDIARELDSLIRSGSIRLLDLVFVSKGSEGELVVLEVDHLKELAPFAALEGEVGGLISLEDIEHAAVDLEPNSSAAVLVWEDCWAAPFVDAMRRAGAVLVEGSRITRAELEAAVALSNEQSQTS